MNNLLQKKSVIRVKEFLNNNLPDIELIELEDTARSAEDAAKSLNQQVGAIVKSLSFKDSKNNFYLCLVSGDQYLSLEKFSYLINDVINKANADEVKFNTGFSIGGVSPFAHINKPKGIFIDKQLERYKTVYAAAGHPHVVFGIEFNKLVELSKGSIVDIVE
tara:strand:+ start:118 stop:603 length:486 start_codon:yes stop_codon:yes gene_type:complete